MRKRIDANRCNSVLTSGTLENTKPFPIRIETISEKKCKQITHHPQVTLSHMTQAQWDFQLTYSASNLLNVVKTLQITIFQVFLSPKKWNLESKIHVCNYYSTHPSYTTIYTNSKAPTIAETMSNNMKIRIFLFDKNVDTLF